MLVPRPLHRALCPAQEPGAAQTCAGPCGSAAPRHGRSPENQRFGSSPSTEATGPLMLPKQCLQDSPLLLLPRPFHRSQAWPPACCFCPRTPLFLTAPPSVNPSPLSGSILTSASRGSELTTVFLTTPLTCSVTRVSVSMSEDEGIGLDYR